MGKTMFGEVSCDLHRCAVYVRVAVPSWDGGPWLSIKATKEGFARDLFKKGTVVEVERSNTDGRRFRIVSVFDKAPARKDACGCPPNGWCDDCCRHDPVPFEDHITIYLSTRYWAENSQRQRFCKVLMQAFGLTLSEASKLMDAGGFTVVCTASQFARFMYFRNEAGLVNGFLDLRMTLVDVPMSQNEMVDVTRR